MNIAKMMKQAQQLQANMHKDRGNAAYESFIAYSDLHSYFIATPDFQKKWYTEVQQKDKAYVFPTPTPPFTAKERETVASLQTGSGGEERSVDTPGSGGPGRPPS